jgi:CO/xanthine dehydrogenase FAD-binding subunit
MAEIAVLAPRDLQEATEARAACPDALVVAGGTDVLPRIAAESRRRQLLDLSRVEERRDVDVGRESLRLGAGVTSARLSRERLWPTALRQAAGGLGSPQVRRQATVAGNLVTAARTADLVPALVALSATVELRSVAGRRTVATADFATGDGVTVLGPDELVVAIRWDRSHGDSRFDKVGIRQGSVVTLASCTTVVDRDAGTMRVVMGGVAPPRRAHGAEAFLGQVLTRSRCERQAVVEEVGRRVVDDVRRHHASGDEDGDQRASGALRRHLWAEMAMRQVGQLLGPGRAGGTPWS